VVAVVVPVELEGWRAAADLRASWGVDLAIADRWEDDRLRYHLQVALEARRGEAVPLRDPATLAAAEELRRQGLAAYKAGNLEQAAACFEAGLARDGCHAALHVSLAVARVKQRRLEDALMAFERALALDPTQTTALRSLAVLYEKRGFVHKAVETWERSLHAVDQDQDQGQDPDQDRRQILGRIQKLLAKTSVPA
jgi:tetratricopeptide (TPR) repeat protein